MLNARPSGRFAQGLQASLQRYLIRRVDRIRAVKNYVGIELICRLVPLSMTYDAVLEIVMKMQAVRSDTIDVVGYDEQTHRLRVTFRHQKPLDFCHVPEQTFRAFISARSKNRFYKRHIEGSFPC